MNKRSILLFIVLFAAAAAKGQETTELWEKPYPMSIQDNSFFIEEAFNQDPRVVQHISSITYFRNPVRELGYTFTQEWPVGGIRHQLSYVIPYASAGRESGIGDLMLNYRYQLLDKTDGVAVAPRFSVIFPTGDGQKGLGMGAMGFEVSLPASKRLSELIAAHVNVGVTLYPSVEVEVDEFDPIDPSFHSARRAIPRYFLGGSVIYLAHPNVNLMLEYLFSSAGEIDPAGELHFSSSHIISPGLRAAINLGDLQIVPGVAVPFRIEQGSTERGIFGYLSFEHGY